jgi:hypothetical protein
MFTSVCICLDEITLFTIILRVINSGRKIYSSSTIYVYDAIKIQLGKIILFAGTLTVFK